MIRNTFARAAAFLALVSLVATPALPQSQIDVSRQVKGVLPIANGGTGTTAGAQAPLVSGTNIKTVNGTTMLGSGDIATPQGTVTSVAPITLGTAGTDLASSVATGTTTPVITLNVPSASASARGALSSADWSTFNGKQAALVSGTSIKTVNGTSLLGSGDVGVGVTSVSGTGSASGLSLSGTVTSTGSLTLGGTLAVLPGNFASQTANTVLAAPNGAAGVPAFRALVAADVPTLNQSTTGSAATLTTPRTITTTGDLSHVVTFDGSANVTAAGTLATVNSNVGTFGSGTLVPVITVNGKGLVTAVSTTAVSAGGSGTVTSVGGTGTVSGLSLSGTVTTSGNLTLGGALDLSSPPAIGGTSAAAITGTTLTANASTSASAANGAIRYGTLTYSDTNHLFTLQSSQNSYVQGVIQNSNAGAAASADLVLANDVTTATTNYGNLGINSSGFTGTGSLNLPKAVYLTGTTGDLVLGTTTSNAIRFVINGGATDAATISTAGLLTANSFASSSAALTGGSVNSTPIGATTASTGAFTTLSASSTVSGTGFSTYLASPPAIGGTAAAAGSFTTLGATGLVTTAASTTSNAGIRLPHGAAPTSPTNGDLWTTTTGLFARINGATVGPYGSGGGSPGGSTTQLQYNNAGAFAGASGITTTGTEMAIAPAANAVPLTVSGYSLTGANAQALLDLSGTWNTTGTPTALKLNITNTASNASSKLLDLQVASASKFSISSSGAISASPSGDVTHQMAGAANAATLQAGLISLIGTATSVTIQSSSNINLKTNNGTQALTINNSQQVTAVSPTGGLGYGTGAGGTVTQATSRTTGVTLNKVTGAITLFSTTTSAGQVTTFTLTDSAINATDTISCTQQTGAGLYWCAATAMSAGSANISIYTPAAVGSAEAPVFNFTVTRGATS
jgi:hypothetical protein